MPAELRLRALHEILRFETDPDGDVRWQVVFALPSLIGPEPPQDHPGVQALLRRLDDADPEIRDWAAFGLGAVRVDTPGVRQGLRRLVERQDEDAAGEAAVALARLGDHGVLPRVLQELADPTVGNLWVEAAAALAAAEALPLLERLQAAGWVEHEDEPRPHLLLEALLACRGNGATSGDQQADDG